MTTGPLTAEWLTHVTTNLDAYIEARAEVLARAAVAREKDRADRRIKDVREKLLAQLRRERDLTGELRRQLKPAVRQADQYRAESKALKAQVRRLLEMTDAWEAELPELIRTAVAVEAIRSALGVGR